ncbi:protein of unknown function [Variovorax sp. YR752]|uniref:STAS-like domain-containing protein n=1 Tax=Variovorax sp. YR752 TaxID=1884383 RepID=UPI000BD317A8|nr:STAS-like domain-containing protein [Variovorax sp. YR752]SOD27634.1 protein of unknown function [Variovorax sp. YR752]
MGMIKVLDHVQSCSSYDDGNVIFELIAPRVRRGENVTLSFEGVAAVPSSFVNAAIIRLAELMPLSQIRSHLGFVNTTRQINEMVRGRFDHVSGLQTGHAL